MCLCWISKTDSERQRKTGRLIKANDVFRNLWHSLFINDNGEEEKKYEITAQWVFACNGMNSTLRQTHVRNFNCMAVWAFKSIYCQKRFGCVKEAFVSSREFIESSLVIPSKYISSEKGSCYWLTLYWGPGLASPWALDPWACHASSSSTAVKWPQQREGGRLYGPGDTVLHIWEESGPH